jgi:hypothetical protein
MAVCPDDRLKDWEPYWHGGIEYQDQRYFDHHDGSRGGSTRRETEAAIPGKQAHKKVGIGDGCSMAVRFDLEDDAAAASARRGVCDPVLAPLAEILANHHASVKCQFDAFV